MSEPIEIILNSSKQMLRLFCGQCGDAKDIILNIDNPDTLEREIAIERILIRFASRVGTEDAESSRMVADEILDRINKLKMEKINVTINDSTDFTTEENAECFLTPVEIIV